MDVQIDIKKIMYMTTVKKCMIEFQLITQYKLGYVTHSQSLPQGTNNTNIPDVRKHYQH